MTGQVDIGVQHRDANHALFLILLECRDAILDLGEGQAGRGALVCARNFQAADIQQLTNSEISEWAYRLSVELRPTQPGAAVVKRILRQLVMADRWEAKLRADSGHATSPFIGRTFTKRQDNPRRG